MQIGEVLQRRTLPALETEVLLAQILGKERSWILAHSEYTLTAIELSQWNNWLERRINHEPIAYITGTAEFYRRSFVTRQGALVPRPSTEGLVDAALRWLDAPADTTSILDTEIIAYVRTLRPHTKAQTLVDIGTGSGCIAITLALERPSLNIIACDLSEEALAVARENAARHHLTHRIDFRCGSLLEPVQNIRQPFLLMSNPPYVPSSRTLPPDISLYEPPNAVVAGNDGLSVIRPLIEQAKNNGYCCGVALECEETQLPTIEQLLQA